jgi:hypothetical protein
MCVCVCVCIGTIQRLSHVAIYGVFAARVRNIDA